jgi:hypothetical protein
MTPIIRVHPRFFTQPIPGNKGVVYWYLCGDGSCYGKRFYEATPACQPSLTAKLKQLEQDGRYSNYMGHRLKGEYSRIFEFVLKDHRFFSFQHLNGFYVTNGNIKDAKQQDGDYRLAMQCWNEFFYDLNCPRLRP